MPRNRNDCMSRDVRKNVATTISLYAKHNPLWWDPLTQVCSNHTHNNNNSNGENNNDGVDDDGVDVDDDDYGVDDRVDDGVDDDDDDDDSYSAIVSRYV